jgi:ribosomal-protein-alanine N-acetyltransferase
MTGIGVAPLRAEHVQEVARLEQRLFSPPWSVADFEVETTRAVGISLVAELPSTLLVGYFISWLVGDELQVHKVAVEPEYRGRGVGLELVKRALSLATQRGAAVATLELRVSNVAALALYRRAGFGVDGRRPSYYSDGEDALLMSCRLCGASEAL